MFWLDLLEVIDWQQSMVSGKWDQNINVNFINFQFWRRNDVYFIMFIFPLFAFRSAKREFCFEQCSLKLLCTIKGKYNVVSYSVNIGIAL